MEILRSTRLAYPVKPLFSAPFEPNVTLYFPTTYLRSNALYLTGRLLYNIDVSSTAGAFAVSLWKLDTYIHRTGRHPGGRFVTWARFIPTPEARSALVAVQTLAEGLLRRRPPAGFDPLFLHGPPGSGKTHLVAGLAAEVGQAVSVCRTDARTFDPENTDPARAADLWVVEDLHHLVERRAVVGTFVQVLDERRSHERPTVVTANAGPARLVGLPARCVSRLAEGLVVGLEPLQAPSRLLLLEAFAQRRHLRLGPGVLTWLADRLGGTARQLDGAVRQLEVLARLQPGPLDVETVATAFGDGTTESGPSVDRIARRVGDYFRVQPRHLLSRRRFHNVVVPRHVSMYLARQLTGLSLGAIGQYFGGRDHSTVLHACRKIEQALGTDPTLGGAVRELERELTAAAGWKSGL